MDADRHVQFAGFADEGLDARIVDMNVTTFYGASVGITFAFVAELTYTGSTQFVVITLQQGASFLDAFRRHVAIVEAAPETEAVFVRSVELNHLLKRSADP